MTVPQQVPLKIKIEDNVRCSPFENPMLFRSLQGQTDILSISTPSLVLYLNSFLFPPHH